MNRIYEIESNLIALMEADHELCEMDDMSLYLAYIKSIHPEISKMPFDCVMNNREKLGIPAMSSVSRSKRKINSKRSDLRPSTKVARARLEKAEEFIEYAMQV